MFDENGFYRKLADKLIENQPWPRLAVRGHWLCKQLVTAAKALDPATYAQLAGESVRDGLRALGVPPFMADALGTGSGIDLKITFGQTPMGNLSKALRVLIPLVCPDISRCPAETVVIKTLISPALGDHLRQMASS